MNSIIINIFIPVSGNKYEMRIPSNSQMYKILALIKKAVEDLENGKYVSDENTVLCDGKTGNMINLNLTAEELGIQNGSKMILI